jgi:pSer/pThr/pTyr-binding forkhead associated (FHA) protein
MMRIQPALIGQEQDFTRPQEPAVPVSFGQGRVTQSLPEIKICLSFVDGLCAGRTGLMLTKQQTRIGRADDCEIILDGETVSRYHCEIILWGSVYVLRDSSRNGTYINGERVSQAQLRDGDQIRVGQNFMLVHSSSGLDTSLITSKPTAAHPLPHAIELKPQIVVKGLEEGVTQPFSEDRITIGRRADNHLVLEDDNVSRHHLAIERRDEAYFVCDLGSANGVFLNDSRADVARLNDGDRLRIGSYQATISLPDRDCVLNFKKLTR